MQGNEAMTLSLRVAEHSTAILRYCEDPSAMRSYFNTAAQKDT
jgi:hypothetical protein